MKTHVRLHAVIAFAVCTLVYLAWHLSSLQLPAVTEQTPWTGSTRRLAAFGDSWSASTRQSSVSALTSKLHLSDETRHAPSWVEVLCMETDCDHLSGLAKDSTFLTPDGFGSVVDNKVYLDATQKLNISYFGKPLPDFKAQVQQFVTETNTADNGGAERANGTSTLITVFFGTWDIWRYAELDFAYGLQAVDDSLATLFEQLRVLADALGPEIGKAMMIVPKVPDPTWLPKWFNERTGPKGSDVHGLAQRQAVFLTQEWNRGLEEKAAAWDAPTGGNIIVPEFDTWFLDQIRASQPAALGYNSQASAPGSSQVEEFTELKSPCVDHTASGGNGSGQTDAHAQTACQDASHHLFWDDTRLSGAAHELLGKHVAELLHQRDITQPDAELPAT